MCNVDEDEIFVCDDCGKIDVVLVNGYCFGDRLLEDVMFIVKNVDNKPKCIGVTVECKEYFDNLNKDKWIKECESYCLDLDVATCGVCKNNGSDVAVWYWYTATLNKIDNSTEFRDYVEIDGMTGTEFIKKIKSGKLFK